MKYVSFITIGILYACASYATGMSATIGELKCADVKVAKVIDSKLTNEIVNYSDDFIPGDGNKTITEISQNEKSKYQNIILISDSKNEQIYTPVPIKNRKKINVVYISAHQRSSIKVDSSKDVATKYKGVIYKKTLHLFNYYSVWPYSIPCKDGIIKKIWKKKKQISADEFKKYNIHPLKKENDLFFLPPDFLITLDIKDNWCQNKICDHSKKMKIKKIERKTQILIDDESNLYQFESAPLYTPDYKAFVSTDQPLIVTPRKKNDEIN